VIRARRSELQGDEVLEVPATAEAIVVEGVDKWFRQHRRSEPFCALRSVSFTVGAGEFVALIGESGCGKTTLLRMIAGLIPADAGRILVDGEPVVGIARHIGFVFQNPALLQWETVAQNVELGLAGVGRELTKERRRQLVAEQLALVGLENFARYHPYQISGGMQQRVGLARALIANPKILLLDEPFGALDAFTRARLQEELARLVAVKGCAALLVTHDVEEALYLANRVVVMGSRPGRVAAVVPVPGSVPRNRQAFVGDPEMAQLKAQVVSQIMGQRQGGEA
jgi:ABC-type nitrate/sulfonate/bicarbonate transport system ATPase subunit